MITTPLARVRTSSVTTPQAPGGGGGGVTGGSTGGVTGGITGGVTGGSGEFTPEPPGLCRSCFAAALSRPCWPYADRPLHSRGLTLSLLHRCSTSANSGGRAHSLCRSRHQDRSRKCSCHDASQTTCHHMMPPLQSFSTSDAERSTSPSRTSPGSSMSHAQRRM